MKHLEAIGETYWQHLCFAGRFGLVLVLAGLCVIVHAIVPVWFETTGSEVVRGLGKLLDEER